MKTVAERKQQLERRRDTLRQRLVALDAELDSHNNPDWDDRASERAEDEVLENMGLSGEQELRAIEAALHRVAEGEYGACTRCGNDISQERLDVLPWTPFCRDCAREVAGEKA